MSAPSETQNNIEKFLNIDFEVKGHVLFDIGLNNSGRGMHPAEVSKLCNFITKVHKNSIFIANHINSIINDNTEINIQYLPFQKFVDSDFINAEFAQSLLHQQLMLHRRVVNLPEYFEIESLGAYLENPQWLRWSVPVGLSAVVMTGILLFSIETCNEVIHENTCRADIITSANAIAERAYAQAHLEGKMTAENRQNIDTASRLLITGIQACRPYAPNIVINVGKNFNGAKIEIGHDVKPLT